MKIAITQNVKDKLYEVHITKLYDIKKWYKGQLVKKSAWASYTGSQHNHLMKVYNRIIEVHGKRFSQEVYEKLEPYFEQLSQQWIAERKAK